MIQDVPIDSRTFLSLIRQPLEERNSAKLARVLRNHWTDRDILPLLESAQPDVRKMAALALGLIGGIHCVTALAGALKDSDPIVNQMAEHALWTLWFRAGRADAHQRVLEGTRYLNGRQLESAEQCFTQAIEFDPTYAEAYNQRSLARYLMENFKLSLEDGLKTVQLMPMHFGAWSGMGHSHAHLHQAEQALRCYHRALDINPYLNCIREIIDELESVRALNEEPYDA